jgi:hypothetical protein
MPLMRVFRQPKIVSDRSCVAFTMAEGIELFACSVSFSALAALSGVACRCDDDYLDLFAAHRAEVEAAASERFDAGHFRSDGVIAVSRHDLPPHAQD